MIILQVCVWFGSIVQVYWWMY